MSFIREFINYNLGVWVGKCLYYKSWALHHILRVTIFTTAFLAVVIGMQLLYPETRTMPYTTIGGNLYLVKSKNYVANQLEIANSSNLIVKLEEGEISVPTEQAGIAIDSKATVDAAANYSFRRRIVPFSILQRRSYPYKISVNQEKVKEFTSKLSVYNKQAQEASVKLSSDGKLTVAKSVDGYSYDVKAITVAMQNATYDKDRSIKLRSTVSKPIISTTAAIKASDRAATLIAKPIKISAEGHTIEIPKTTIASWIEFSPNPLTGELDIYYDKSKIESAISGLSKYVYIAQKPNLIKIVDGEDALQKTGAKGRMLLVEETVDSIISSLDKHETTLEAAIKDVSSTTTYLREYTASSKGINALINYWTSTHSGDYGISVISKGGSIASSINGDKKFPSASLYKLYVADVVFDMVNSGELSLSRYTTAGYTVSECIQLMIVYSNNECGVALGNFIGWSYIDSRLYPKGFASTTLAGTGPITTANNMSKFLVALENGSLVPNSQRDTLITHMKNQIYRSGIPAGSKGVVADKVGFLGQYNHDAAIVYGPKMTYIITVMSSSSSYNSINDIAKQISSVINQ